MRQRHIYTVSELNRSLRTMLEQQFPRLSVSGEISNLRKPYSGHIYFTLKDDNGQLRAVLFKMQQRYLEKQPADGQAVICRGRLTVYEPRGDYQLIVDHIDFHGAGSLQAAFEQLKKKLAAEGLFDQEKKKNPPPLPRHITLVTSPGGAAVHDFIRIATRRFPLTRLAVYPVAVQGEQAAAEISRAIETVNAQLETDIIVLCRGGGSIEDLQPFNDEQLARTISASALPVVSAVGHEIDFTIADFVSDLRAPTPSTAAELLLPDRNALRERINELAARLARITDGRLQIQRQRLQRHRERLSDFSHLLTTLALRLDQQSSALIHGMENNLARRRQQVAAAGIRLERQNPVARLQVAKQRFGELRRRFAATGRSMVARRRELLQQQRALLEMVGPKATLARGYAVIRTLDRGEVLTDAASVSPGTRAEVLLHKGSLEVHVEKSIPERAETKTPEGG